MSGGCVVAGTLRGSLDVSLLTPHADFLSQLAGEETLSGTIALVIEQFRATTDLGPRHSIRRVRKHFSVPDAYIDYINELSIRWGVGRSEAMRRILDHVMKVGFTPEVVTTRAA